MKSNRDETPSRVEFRWRQHEEHFAKLLADAAQSNGRSESEQARELLKTALTSSDEVRQAVELLQKELLQIREQIRQLLPLKAGLRVVHENIYQFRDSLATSVATILVDAAGLDPATAEARVKQIFDAD
jgi:hypothetical protein